MPAITEVSAEETKRAWGRRLLAARKAADRTQEDVAAAVGIPQKAISRAEQGEGGLAYYLAIAHELRVRIVIVEGDAA